MRKALLDIAWVGIKCRAMFDMRPAAYVLGVMISVLGGSMIVPMAADLIAQNGEWGSFAQAGILTIFTGLSMMFAFSTYAGRGLSIQQTFLITTGVWLVLPIFGALPFVFGATGARFVDAFFEAMSGLTTTGSTVFTGLDDFPVGLLLWRGLLQWFGGIGIIVVAMVFLPELRVGGMQIFRSEGFDTFGKILPRAAMTTIATGGFANSDASFGGYGAGVEYAASVFMILAALPFVRYVQLLAGDARPFWADSQVRAFVMTVLALVAVMVVYLTFFTGSANEIVFRKAVFNTISIVTGTGYASADYMQWGPVAIVVLFCAGLIGGCAGSTSCSIKVFRYQILFAAIATQVRRLHVPHGVFDPRYENRPIAEDVLSSVMAFFVLFFVTLGIVAILLALTGLDFITSVSGAVAALANIGPGLGPEIGPAGSFAGLNDMAKWILSLAMLIGRLELMAVFVLLTAAFWRG